MNRFSYFGFMLTVLASVASGQVTLNGSRVKPKTNPTNATLGYGQPQAAAPATPRGSARWEARTIAGVFGGRKSSASILHLRGLDGIEKAPGLPDGARRLLEMHVRTLRPGEPDHYLINTKLAEEWSRNHPVPATLKPSDNGGDSHSGCDVISTHCAGEAYQHAAEQGSREWQKLYDQAVADWKHAAAQLSNEWNVVEDCFADHTLPALKVPVRFSTKPSMTIPLQMTGSKDLGGGGSASGTVSGSVGLGFPMDGDFQTTLEVFYIPCLPFVVRPRSINGSGAMTVSEKLTASVTASGKFDKVFTIPPSGGPQIPIEVIPIMIGDVPIAELDVSAYIEGTIEVGGQGKAAGSFELDNPHKAEFDFACSGAGCTGTPRSLPEPTTTSESATMQGQVFVKPAVFTALQLDFDVDALSARVGPQPYLLGSVAGCGAMTASQTGGGSSTSGNYGLMADLDWGVELRAEALIARKVIDPEYRHSVTGDKHLWFRDLAPGGSTALVATVGGPTQVATMKSARYKVRMPSCYPYTNAVQYRLTWTGNATPAPTPACQWQTGEGTCNGNPTKDLALDLTWPGPGTYIVTVVPVSDDHHRVFSPAPKPSQLTVSVGARASGGGVGSAP